MKARNEDGQINFYVELPSKFLGVTGNYVGGFNLVDTETQEKEGFFEVVEPFYNRTLESLSPVFFDESKRIFTYTVEPKPGLPTLEQAKINKIAELKMRGRNKFNETDWYYTRELRMKDLGITKPIPADVIKQNQDLYALLDKKEAEINAITDLEKVLDADTDLEKPTIREVLTPEPIETQVALTPAELLDKAKVLESTLRSADYADYGAVTLALAMAEETDEEKTLKAQTINDAIAKLVSLNPQVDLSAYEVVLLAVKKSDYTTDSWATYEAVLLTNVVMSSNTQAEINTAVDNIQKAQINLVVVSSSAIVSPAPELTSEPIVPPVTESAPVNTTSSTDSASPASPATTIPEPVVVPVSEPAPAPAPDEAPNVVS